MHTEAIYQLALTQTPQIGSVAAKTLISHLGSAAAVFNAKYSLLSKMDGIGPVKAFAIKAFSDFAACEAELRFIEKYSIQMLFLNDPGYPKRLLHCYDSPALLFYKGEADLNASRIVSIIGTRSNTAQAKIITEKLVEELAAANITIVSGLAFGVDTIAHKAAIANRLATIGVLAHGLDTIYPAENASMAKQMAAEAGGLLTEFTSGIKPDRHNFPTRNRIVAGMADAAIVIETDVKGGSMITAELACNYNRDVFAFPGRVTDVKSRGCNYLIRSNKAGLITCAADLLEAMNWLPRTAPKQRPQRSLFVELTAEERIVADLLNTAETLPVDELNARSNLTSSAVANALLSLELQGLVCSLPGKMYRMQ